jgi:hypothetical protein
MTPSSPDARERRVAWLLALILKPSGELLVVLPASAHHYSIIVREGPIPVDDEIPANVAVVH